MIRALHGADTNFGGNSGAMTETMRQQRVQSGRYAHLAAADLRGFSGNCDPHGQAPDGTLGTVT